MTRPALSLAGRGLLIALVFAFGWVPLPAAVITPVASVLHPHTMAPPGPSPVDVMFAAHDCATTAAPARPMLLVAVGGVPRLVRDVPAGDGHEELGDWLAALGADWYGYCEEKR